MNCRHARQLISPYLDHQLTGREMLALQEHFSGCQSCADEMNSILQVKRLLRGLHSPYPERNLPGVISLRLTETEARANGWRVLNLPPTFSLPPISSPPPRGRRLATALALSCLTILSVAAPSRDVSHSTSGLLSSPFLVPTNPVPDLASLSGPEMTDTANLNQIPTRIVPAGDTYWTVISPSASMQRSDFSILAHVEPPHQSRLSVFLVQMPSTPSLPARFDAASPVGYSR